MLTSSSSFAVIGYRTLELYYFILFYFIYLIVVRGTRTSEDGLKMEEKTQVPEVGFEPGTFRSCVDHSNHYATDTPPIPDVLLVLVAPKHIHRNVTTTLQSMFTPNPHPTGHPALFADQPPPHGPPRTLRRPPPIYTVHLALLPRPGTDLGLNVSDNIRCDVINSYLLTLQIWGVLKNTYILLAASSIGITPHNRPQSQAFCPEINRMSHEQKMLRLRIDNTKDAEMSNALKQKRNRLQHAIRRKSLENATNKLDQKIEEFERLHDGAKMFKPVRLLYRTPYMQPTIHDDQGRTIQDQEEYGKPVSDLFTEQFQGDVKQGISAFTGEPRPLNDPITES